MVRKCGAQKVFFASASPPVRYQNVYGIDMPATKELIAHKKSIKQTRTNHEKATTNPFKFHSKSIQNLFPQASEASRGRRLRACRRAKVLGKWFVGL